MLARLQKLWCSPQHFCTAVTRLLLKGMVHKQDVCLVVGNQNGIMRGVQRFGQQGLALFSTHPGGDVLLHGDISLYLPACISHRRDIPLHQVCAAILAVVKR